MQSIACLAKGIDAEKSLRLGNIFDLKDDSKASVAEIESRGEYNETEMIQVA